MYLMPKLYSQNSAQNELQTLKPSKETIAFLLNYSKALHVVKTDPLTFETFVN